MRPSEWSLRTNFKGERIVKRFASFGMGLLALAEVQCAYAQLSYPEKPVRVLVGVTIADTIARIIGTPMSEALGRPVVVEPLMGVAGNIAAERVAKSPPDGYTVLVTGDAAMTTNVTLFPNLAYDPMRDFAPVSLIVDSVNILVVHPSVPAKSVKDLVALAKARPGMLTYASTGHGTSQHLGGELLKAMAGIDIVHVPYKAASAVMPDLVAGRVGMQFGNISVVLPWVRDGRLRGLAVSSAKRAPQVPDLPTVAELGYPGFEATAWAGMLVPAGTPESIVRRLHQEVERAVAPADMRKRLGDMGFVVIASNPATFGAQIKDEISRKGKIVRASGAKAN
jgi:tripartite-type tricarboxylate transporter receptor subunit TctC